VILNLAFRWITSRDSVEWTFLCLEVTVSFIITWYFADLIWINCLDGFVIAVTAQFLLLKLEHVCFKRRYKFLRWWILFVKAEVRTTSMSRGWILILYLLKTNKQIFYFVFVFLRIECLELLTLGLRSLIFVRWAFALAHGITASICSWILTVLCGLVRLGAVAAQMHWSYYSISLSWRLNNWSTSIESRIADLSLIIGSS